MDRHQVAWLCLIVVLNILARQATAQVPCDSAYAGEGNAVAISSECFSNGTVHYSWSSGPTVDYLRLEYSCSGPDGSLFQPDAPLLDWADGRFLQGASVASIPNWEDGWSCSFFACYEVEARAVSRYNITETPCTVRLSTSTQVPHPTPTAAALHTSVSLSATPTPGPTSSPDLTVVYMAVFVVVGIGTLITFTVIVITTICCCATKRSRKPEHLFIDVDNRPEVDIDEILLLYETKLPPAISEISVIYPLGGINDLLIMDYEQSPSVQKVHRTILPGSTPSRDTLPGSLPVIPEGEADTTSTGSTSDCTVPRNHFSTSATDRNSYFSNASSEERARVLDDNAHTDIDRCSDATENADHELNTEEPSSSENDDTESTELERSFEIPIESYNNGEENSSASSTGYIQLQDVPQPPVQSLPLNATATGGTEANNLPINSGLASVSGADVSPSPDPTQNNTQSAQESLAVGEVCSLVLEEVDSSGHYPTPLGYVPNNDSGFSD